MKYEIGDLVEYTNVFGYTHQYVVKQRSRMTEQLKQLTTSN